MTLPGKPPFWRKAGSENALQSWSASTATAISPAGSSGPAVIRPPLFCACGWIIPTRRAPPLPDEAQIKELLSPIVLDCILQVEEHYPLDKATIKYYHPDFDPNEHGRTWRTLEISLAPDVPRTETLLDPAGFTVN